MGLDSTRDINQSGLLHVHHLKAYNKRGILLNRNLDTWQRFDSDDAFNTETRMPEMRRIKTFELIYMKVE